ncbi:MAG: glycosyltransferase family 1 protein [Chromatiaceae bacterium]
MRVGVVIRDDMASTMGGGFTFQSSVLAGIQSTPLAHRFVILSIGDGLHAPDAPVPWINLARQYAPSPTPFTRYLLEPLRRIWSDFQPKGRVGQNCRQLVSSSVGLLRRIRRRLSYAPPPVESPSLLDRAVQDFALDVIWFITPCHKPLSAPFFITVWDLQHRRQPYFPEVSLTGQNWDARENFYRAILPRAARIITGTAVGKDEVVRFYGAQSENVVVNPFPLPETLVQAEGTYGEPDIHPDAGSGFLLYPAQFWPHKNHVNLLLALKILNDRDGLMVPLVLVGSDKGNLGYVRETIDALGLAAQVRVLGFVSDARLVALYRRAMALVFPTFFGPDNLPPLEAFGLDCPVIASRVPGAEEQLGDAALLFDPARPEELADCIRQLHHDPGLRIILIARGRARLIDRLPCDYIRRIGTVLNDFEPIRRCWGGRYLHT